MEAVTEDPDPMAADEAALRVRAAALADGIEAALGPWVQRCVEQALVRAGQTGGELCSQAVVAGEAARAEIGPRVRALLEQDIDEQRANPLALVRPAVRFPTEVLRLAGIPACARDADAERLFPDDPYDLTPASFADLDAALVEPGIEWGAAKAHVHLSRRRAEGLR